MSYQYTSELAAEADLLLLSTMFCNQDKVFLLVKVESGNTYYITDIHKDVNFVVAMARNGTVFKPN